MPEYGSPHSEDEVLHTVWVLAIEVRVSADLRLKTCEYQLRAPVMHSPGNVFTNIHTSDLYSSSGWNNLDRKLMWAHLFS